MRINEDTHLEATVSTNSLQEYQNNVQYEMAKFRVMFVEREYQHPMLLPLRVSAVRERIDVLDVQCEKDISEGEELIVKLLSMIEELERQNFLESAARSYGAIGHFYWNIGCRGDNGSTEKLKKAKLYTEKTCELFERIGHQGIELITAQNNLAAVEGRLFGMHLPVHGLDYHRAYYNDKISRRGEDEVYAINEGVEFAMRLDEAKHGVESERLLTKLIATSRRAHGPLHNCTQRAESALKRVQERLVYIKSKEGWKEGWYQALRYENDGERCVVQGPLPEDDDGQPKIFHEGETFSVPTKHISPLVGTPVVCHGLRARRTSHLNGKIGDLRSYVYKSQHSKCVVHFEEEGLEPTTINVANTRILFELPNNE